MKLKINSRYQWGSTKKLLINVHDLKTWRITTPLSSKSTFCIELFFYSPELDAKILYEIVMEVQKYSKDFFLNIMVQNIWYKTRQIPYALTLKIKTISVGTYLSRFDQHILQYIYRFLSRLWCGYYPTVTQFLRLWLSRK